MRSSYCNIRVNINYFFLISRGVDLKTLKISQVVILLLLFVLKQEKKGERQQKKGKSKYI